MKSFLLIVWAAVAALFAPMARAAHDALFSHMARSGLVLGFDRIPTTADFERGSVTNPATSEVLKQSLYDSLLYAQAGQTSLTFFQQPVGQGNTTALGGTAGNPKSKSDTNMALGGQLSNGLMLLVQSIELHFFPGSVATANTFTIDTVSVFNAAASLALTAQVDDVSAFYQGGWLEFNILQKTYLTEAPLMRFPPKTHLQINGALASTSATQSEQGIANAFADGRPYYTEPELLLRPTMNFEVKLNWPGLVALTSGFNGRVTAILDGFTMRASQ